MKKKFNPNVRTLDHLPISEILKTIIEGYRLDKKIDQTRIVEVWADVMGSGIQTYTTGIYLKNSTLFVKLSSAIVRDELSYGKFRIIDNLNRELGREVIKELKLV